MGKLRNEEWVWGAREQPVGKDSGAASDREVLGMARRGNGLAALEAPRPPISPT